MVRINRNLKPRAPDPVDQGDEEPFGVGEKEEQQSSAVARAAIEGGSEDDYFSTGATGKSGDVVSPRSAKPAKKGNKKTSAAEKSGNHQRPTQRLGEEAKATTRKGRAELQEWRGKNHGRKIEEFLRGHVERARKHFGHTAVFHGSETKRLIVGIPIPSLAIEFVLAQDVWPLGVIYHLVAKHKTGKSGFAAEIMRWFYMAGGFGVLNEVEDKFSPDWYSGILGPIWFASMPFNACDSVESWQNHLSKDIENDKKLMEGTKKAPGPGRTFPIAYVVDSILGKLSESSQESIVREGSAGRGFPVEALIISRYMATMPRWLDGWPFSVILVNHLKLDKNPDTNQDIRNMAGGKRTLFQEAFELELRKTGRLECTEFEGYYVDIRCAENSFGPDGRSIRTRVLWWDEPDPETGDFIQKTVWDWDWSTVHLLFSIIKGTGERNTRLRHLLRKSDFHMDFASPTKMSATAWSKTLGVTEKQALPWNEMGALIQKSPEIMTLLRRALCIKKRPLLEGDYLDEMNALAKDMP